MQHDIHYVALSYDAHNVSVISVKKSDEPLNM